MFKNIISLATVAFALISGTEAQRNRVSSTADGHGLIAGVASSSIGFNARFFDYPGGDLIRFNSNDWVANSYASGSPRTTTNSVTEPNFSFDDGLGGKSIYSMYNINMWNVLIELKGYFIAPESGLYTVTINEANDGAWIWLGNGAFDGCSQETTLDSYDDVLLGVRSDGAYSSYVYLNEGVMYPMRTTYINIYFGAEFEFEIVTPSGFVINNFTDYIVNFENNDIEACVSADYGQQVSISTQSVETDISTTSTSYNIDVATINNQATTILVEEVYYPSAVAGISTSTVTNTFAATTTVTSIVTSNGVASTVTIVIDQVSADSTALVSTTGVTYATTTVTGQTISGAYGCSINTDSVDIWPGFHATVYNYDECFGFLEASYYGNQYTTESVMGKGYNITEPNFSVKAWLGATDHIYGAYLDSWKGYVAQLTGYVYAKETGLYQFAVNYSDDGSMVWVGTESAFSCCQPDDIPYNSNDGALLFVKDEESATGYVHLTEGNYYPIRVVLVNWYGDSVMDMSMIAPSGESVHDDWSDWIVSFEDYQSGFCSV
ncbi:hypothetical protein C6P40_003211 [Pichia californica]|uniref:PA14 domain-containing protein n=1 Tax=Pichia californica TaxID=460514 RepID=A0A9P6WJG0_9ASCO|nr:hypothetical protein C6P42_003029 [[Candida] californica]KAG0686888.1 hypothetical protein C6P40_003211 [[Candida] californica]